MKKAIYAGTFDPITNGHMDLIKRASRLFDEVYVTIFHHPSKKTLFTVEERVKMIEEAVSSLPHVHVAVSTGLEVDFAHEIGAQVIVRGLRTLEDFSNESTLAHANEYLDDSIEMVFLMSRLSHTFISSSTVKEIAYHQGDVTALVPLCVNEALLQVYRKGE